MARDLATVLERGANELGKRRLVHHRQPGGHSARQREKSFDRKKGAPDFATEVENDKPENAFIADRRGGLAGYATSASSTTPVQECGEARRTTRCACDARWSGIGERAASTRHATPPLKRRKEGEWRDVPLPEFFAAHADRFPVLDPQGGMTRPGLVRNSWDRAIKRLGLRDDTPHDLRRKWATATLTGGCHSSGAPSARTPVHQGHGRSVRPSHPGRPRALPPSRDDGLPGLPPGEAGGRLGGMSRYRIPSSRRTRR